MTPITKEQAETLANKHSVGSGGNCTVDLTALLTVFRQQVIADLAQRSGRPWPVKAADHPDFAGGDVWSTLELHFLDERDKRWATVVASMKAKLEQSEARAQNILRLVKDDGFAITFQTMGQYRSALIAALNKEPGHEA